MQKYLLLILLFAAVTSVNAQKKPLDLSVLDHSVYDAWQSIGEKLISNDGSFTVYTITPQEGDGKLIIREDGSDGAYKAVPPKYSDRLVGMKDGEIFHSITYGKNLMGSYASQLTREQRWQVIHYIKSKQNKNKPAADATAAVAAK